MSKRSQGFERIDNDAYYTPERAIRPLIPHLRKGCNFAEPCAGDGSIVRVLEALGMKCTYSGDITSGQDAKTLTAAAIGDAAVIVTNPPYAKPEMHLIIDNLRRIRPTWVLLNGDWIMTHQSAPLMRYCSDIVPIGRVKWISGSKSVGFEDSTWLRFSAMTTMSTNFHPMGGRNWVC